MEKEEDSGAPGPSPQPSGDAVRATGISRRHVALLFLLLLAATLTAYQPAWRGGLLWDDNAHITRSDLRSLQGLWRIWFEPGATQQYYPLLHSAFWIMHRLWGDQTLYYHLVSILLHVLSAFLIAVILRRLGVPGAWLAATIFALHPVQVESVAWISEIKNTLSGALCLGSALAYLQFDRNRKASPYALSLILFILALLSKTAVATVPVALLVILWWLRGRLELRRDILPLLPFLACGAAAGWITIRVEQILIGARGAEFQLTSIERILVAGRAFWFYLQKLFWPANLVFIYPRWQVRVDAWWQYLFPLGAAILFAGLWLVRKRSRAPLAALLVFAVILFPALGFFNVFPFRFSFVADHFQYLAGISVTALCCGGLATLLRRRISRGAIAAAGVLLLAAPLAVLTRGQSGQYAGAETLYRETIRRNPSCWLAYGQLGILEMNGHGEEAVKDFREAARLRPGFPESHYNLANALQRMGNLREAGTEYREALRLDPGFVEAHNNLGNALQRSGRVEEAVEEYREALRLDPDLAEAHNNLGYAYRRMFRFADAMKEWRVAIRIDPDYSEAHYNLGATLQALGQWKAAIAEFQEVLRITPDHKYACNGLGRALERMGRLEEAAAQYREALRLDPDFSDARENLAGVMRRLEGNSGPARR